ncbi:hypothetical protein F5Y05DRAFT_411292 [Hypoxylon sp. FL0543]|nr:hypothetical protein F5Y05DRAFT_411292 [Hypoxylon sp. FL0543]
MASQSASASEAVTAQNGNNASSVGNSTSSLGKRKRDEADTSCFKLVCVEKGSWEVDQNDFIRGMHMPFYEGSSELRIKERPAESPSRSQTQHPIQWRRHGQVAMELGAYKTVRALHDLVDPSNTHIMVLYRDEATFQCAADQAEDMMRTVLEWLNLGGRLILSLSGVVSGPDRLEQRRKTRQGGLVDGNYEYIPMDWAVADKLLSKEFPKSNGKDLIVVQIRPDCTSLAKDLIPGRRKVPVPDEDDWETQSAVSASGICYCN